MITFRDENVFMYKKSVNPLSPKSSKERSKITQNSRICMSIKKERKDIVCAVTYLKSILEPFSSKPKKDALDIFS